MSATNSKMRLSFLFRQAHVVWPPTTSPSSSLPTSSDFTRHHLQSEDFDTNYSYDDENSNKVYHLHTKMSEKSTSQESLLDITALPLQYYIDEKKLASSSKSPKNASAGAQPHTMDSSRAGGYRKHLVMVALSLVIFLVSLDTVVITTALPTIAHQFHITNSGYAWIGSAYLLTNAAFVPFWGRISDVFGRKPTLLVASAFFLAGSIISALAPAAPALIVGRAIQGFGGGGMGALVNIIISDIFDIRNRGLMFGIIGAVWAISSSMGPLIGAGFAQNISWPWMFWINLPIEAVAVLLLVFTLHVHNPTISIWTGIKSIDWFGAFTMASATITLLLGLQFGGVSYPWSSAAVVCLLVVGVCLFFIFFYTQFKVSPFPIMPFRIFSTRTTLCALAVTFFDAFVFNSVAYFLPLYYQTVLDKSPIRSGVLMLPMALPLSAVSLSAGWIMERTGRYVELLRGGLLLMTLGIGLLISLPSYLDLGRIVPFLVIIGIGFGPNFHAPLLALQANIQSSDMAAGTTTFGFIRMLSGAIGIVLCQVVYQCSLRLQLHHIESYEALLGKTVTNALENGSIISSTDLKELDSNQHELVRRIMTQAMSRVWILLCCASFLGLVVSMGIERRKLDRVATEPITSRVSTAGTEADRKDVAPATERFEMVDV